MNFHGKHHCDCHFLAMKRSNSDSTTSDSRSALSSATKARKGHARKRVSVKTRKMSQALARKHALAQKTLDDAIDNLNEIVEELREMRDQETFQAVALVFETADVTGNLSSLIATFEANDKAWDRKRRVLKARETATRKRVATCQNKLGEFQIHDSHSQ
jgi:hypothetical protein